jgi:hypothetical protein
VDQDRPPLRVVAGGQDRAELLLAAGPVARHRQVDERGPQPPDQRALGLDRPAGPQEAHDGLDAVAADDLGELVGIELAAAVQDAGLDHVEVVPDQAIAPGLDGQPGRGRPGPRRRPRPSRFA